MPLSDDRICPLSSDYDLLCHLVSVHKAINCFLRDEPNAAQALAITTVQANEIQSMASKNELMHHIEFLIQNRS